VSPYGRWSRAESDYLEFRVGDVPFPELAANFRRHAQQQGWPHRSDKAITMRLKRMGQKGRARCGATVTTGGVAAILGCPATRVEAWLRRPAILAILQPRWVGSFRYFERSAWVQLAREHPQVFGGFEADVLFMLLEDRELADSIAARYSRNLGDWRVRCVETGRIYSSCGAVAKEHHVTQACVSLAVRQRRPIKALGLTFLALRHPAA
jgi:hypothetical protein